MPSQRAKTGRARGPGAPHLIRFPNADFSLREFSVPLFVKERTCFGNDLGRSFYFTGGDKTSFGRGYERPHGALAWIPLRPG